MPEKPKPKVGWVDWMLGRTPESMAQEEEKKRKQQEEMKRNQENIRKAIQGAGVLKKVVQDAEAYNKKNKK